MVPTRTAAFDVSNTTNVAINGMFDVTGIVFNPGASSYTIAVNPYESIIFFHGDGGVTNNSGVTQYFSGGGEFFEGRSTAGSNVVYLNSGSNDVILFGESSNAGSATIINVASDPGQGANETAFEADASAGNSSITNSGITDGYFHSWTAFKGRSTAGESTILSESGTYIIFADNATAGSCTLTAETGASVVFNDVSSADAATLVVNGGSVQFFNASEGGTARIELLTGDLSIIRSKSAPLLTVGSLEGSGPIFLGQSILAIGSNNLSTAYSGVVQDGGTNGGTGGALSKVGTGSLTLSGPNNYTGGTTVDAGALVVSNTTGSATGLGAVQINAGTLGGGGTISGAVTVGTGSGSGATLQPSFGTNKPVTLTMQSQLTFKSDSTYNCHLKSPQAEVVANGVTIENGAQFLLTAPKKKLPTGSSAIVISNTSSTPISGTFANLPDGATITSGGNTYHANYEGGDGNDLTLTVQ